MVFSFQLCKILIKRPSPQSAGDLELESGLSYSEIESRILLSKKGFPIIKCELITLIFNSGFFIPTFYYIDQTGNLGPQATEFISYINIISGVKGDDEAAGAGKRLRTNSIEVFLRRRILFFCNLKCVIARENALSQLKPSRIVGECREFE